MPFNFKENFKGKKLTKISVHLLTEDNEEKYIQNVKEVAKNFFKEMS